MRGAAAMGGSTSGRCDRTAPFLGKTSEPSAPNDGYQLAAALPLPVVRVTEPLRAHWALARWEQAAHQPRLPRLSQGCVALCSTW